MKLFQTILNDPYLGIYLILFLSVVIAGSYLEKLYREKHLKTCPWCRGAIAIPSSFRLSDLRSNYWQDYRFQCHHCQARLLIKGSERFNAGFFMTTLIFFIGVIGVFFYAEAHPESGISNLRDASLFFLFLIFMTGMMIGNSILTYLFLQLWKDEKPKS